MLKVKSNGEMGARLNAHKVVEQRQQAKQGHGRHALASDGSTREAGSSLGSVEGPVLQASAG